MSIAKPSTGLTLAVSSAGLTIQQQQQLLQQQQLQQQQQQQNQLLQQQQPQLTQVSSITPVKNMNQLNSLVASKLAGQLVSPVQQQQQPQQQQVLHTLGQKIQLSAQSVSHQHLLGVSPGTPAQPTSSSSPAASILQSPQPAANGADNPQEAISAIVQSLMSAEAQFEQKKLEEQGRSVVIGRQQQLPTNSSPAQLLPTVPVPAASLVGQRLPTGKVTLQNMRTVVGSSTPVSGAQQQVKVTMSQLAAQLARPVQASSSNPPTYSQAVASGTAPATLQTSPRRRLTDQASPADGGSSSNSGPASLQALLLTEDMKQPQQQQLQPQGGTASLLERLVTGGSNLNPLATQLPCVQQVQNCASGAANGGGGNNSAVSGGNDITLAALLANPLPHQQQKLTAGSSGTSPTKISPLLQQLQQPVQTVHQQQQQQPRVYPGLTSPRPQPPSPRLVTTTSPRPIQPVQSPRGAGMPPSPGRMMQPPRYPATTHHSILSAQLSQPPKSAAAGQQQHMLLQNSSQGLMAVTSQGLVPVTHHQNVLQVRLFNLHTSILVPFA